MNAIAYIAEVESGKQATGSPASEQMAYLRFLSVVLNRPLAELSACLQTPKKVEAPVAA